MRKSAAAAVFLAGGLVMASTTVASAAEFQPTRIKRSGTTYTLDDRSETFEKDIAKLSKKIPNASMADVMRNVNHSAQEPCGVPPTNDSVQFCWNDEDNEGTTWIPQGLTGSWDADADGRWGRHRIIAASWYDREGLDGKDRGARVTFVNYDDPDKPEYRHVLLVVPDREGSFTATAPDTHAGGIAWVGDKLYMADTDLVRVFDMGTIWKTRADSTHKKIGMDGGKAYAADYRYAIPQVGYYKPNQKLRFSSIALDRTSSPNSLITAEYKGDRDGVTSEKNANAKIVRWKLDENEKLVSSGGTVRSGAAYVTSRANINGAVTHGDEFVLSTSEYNRQPAWRHRADVGSSKRYTSVRLGGPEDVTYQPQGKRMWTLTEYDGRRTVFGIPFSSIGD